VKTGPFQFVPSAGTSHRYLNGRLSWRCYPTFAEAFLALNRMDLKTWPRLLHHRLTRSIAGRHSCSDGEFECFFIGARSFGRDNIKLLFALAVFERIRRRVAQVQTSPEY
jgi:hypothetical protein